MISEPLFASRQHPIFVLGILQRSGTNYLNNLLLLHPEIKSPGLVWEDFFLAHGDLLAFYMERVLSSWPHQWVEEVGAEFGSSALLKYIGNSLIDFMEAQYRNRLEKGFYPLPERTPVNLVSATPSVRNLHMFFDVFPNAAPIIIVRDGRALVESGVRSFGWDYDEGMRMWAAGARLIQDFCRNPKHEGKYLLVRYEDLYTRTEQEMGKVLDFLGLDRSRYDFQASQNLGVMGSSELVKTDGSLHWKSIDKSAGFNPLARASEWSPHLRSRFEWIAGEQMRALGYMMDKVSPRPTWNRLVDRIYGLGIKLNRHSSTANTMLQALRYQLMHVPMKQKKSEA
jgi:protein-tyrosine sulfotransferase